MVHFGVCAVSSMIWGRGWVGFSVQRKSCPTARGPGGGGSLLQDRVCESERLSLEKGIIFQETDQLVEDFIQTRETATLGQGGFGEFTLVQGSKIQLNQLWYRLRVPGSQRHIPTQKFLKYPPGGPRGPGLVHFAIGLVNSVLNLPDEQVKIYRYIEYI